MKKQSLASILIFALAILPCLGAQELETALKATQAPQQEYIRIPASYVLSALQKSARNSGNSQLRNLKIENTMSGTENSEITINLTGLNLFEAIEAVAKDIGGIADIKTDRVVIVAPNQIEKTEPVEEELPTRSRNKNDPFFSFADISHALVFVENGQGKGSAFIASMDGTVYLFSNQHNLIGATQIAFNTMNGGKLKPKTFEYSRTHDLFRMELAPEEVDDLTALELCMTTPNIEDRIFMYGNSAGGGVATELDGEILGVGPADIEIDAKMVPGNSGSPILNQKGEVIGVATYATLGAEFEKDSPYAKMFKGTRFSKIRRYGIRIPESGWTKGNLPMFLKQTYELEDMQTYLIASYTLLKYALGDDSSAATARSIIAYYDDFTVNGKPVLEFHLEESDKELRQLVRSFTLAYEEASERQGKRSESEMMAESDRLLRLFTDASKSTKIKANDTRWYSTFLKDRAQTVVDIADEIIQQVSSISE